MKRFPIVMLKSDGFFRQCLYQKLDEPRNQRAAKKFDCARPNEALKVAEKAPRTSLLMKNSPQYRPGKETSIQSRKGLAFFVNGIVLSDSLHLSVFLLPQQKRLNFTKRSNYSTEIYLCFQLAC